MILVVVLGLAQLLSLVVLPLLLDVHITRVTYLKIIASVSFGIVVEQACFTVFVRRGLKSKLAWLAAAAGLLAYAGFDSIVSFLTKETEPLTLELVLLYFSLSLTGNTIWTYGIWLGASLFMLSQHQVAEEQQKNLMLERAHFETRLSFLESQINPHFLFNALNTVASLIVLERAPDARNAVIHLGHLLRRSLNGEGSPLATLDDEIEAARAYLAIEKLRFADRLDVEWNIAPGLGGIHLPRFSLQPLVENVVKHGVAHALAPVKARITINSGPSGIAISVWNDGLPDRPAAADPQRRPGVGLRNLEQRLHLLFAGEASLETDRPEPGAFECRVTLPLPALREAAE
ncbi:histidine kinase [Maricaulis sp.]|uniref:sensor histidine kinase n=1 Tax=Maricaulis sp. TaxID=1486257 RepID=UPI0032998F71